MEEPGEAASLGSSLLVPSVQELAKDSLTTVPPRYLRPEQDPPFSSQSTSQTPLPHIPVIDFHCLLSGDGMESELEKLHHACKEWGFFQVRMYSTHLHKGLLANWTLQIKTHTKKTEVARSKKIHETPCKDLFCFVFRFSIHPIIEFSRLWVILDKPR